MGNIITLKGIDLALHALKASQTNATFTLVGDGDYLTSARRLVQKLCLGQQVNFCDRLPREEVLKIYSQFDVFLFPSLHDTGGYAAIEAMFNELPVICLDCGGPAAAVQEGCGLKISLGHRREVIAGLSDAIRNYDQNRQRVREHGHNARETILRNYDWEKKGEQMNDVYKKAVDTAATTAPANPRKAYTGVGGPIKILHRMVSLRGMAVAMLALILVGMMGFLSLNRLKKVAGQIVNDTLPGLSLAHDRKVYLEIRNHVLDLAAAGKKNEALTEYNEVMLPEHARVKTAGDQLFEYNIRQGEERSRAIMTACTITQVAVALIGVVIFILGFFIGLFR